LVRKASDRRDKKISRSKQSKDDFYRIRIIMFLFSFSESGISALRGKGEYGIRQHPGDLRVLLEKMIQDNWISKRQDPHSKNITLYSLTLKGKEIAQMIHEWDENNPFLKLDAFRNVKSLGTSNE